MKTGATEPPGMGSLLGDGFLKVNAALGGGISVVVTILVAVYLPGHPVPLWLLALVGFLLLWVISAVLLALKASTDMARTLYNEKGGAFVEKATTPFSPYDTAKCIFIVRFTGTAALPMGASVIISTAEDKHERPLGTGLVRRPNTTVCQSSPWTSFTRTPVPS